MTTIINNKNQRYRLAAVSLICLILAFTGCATKQDVMRVDESVQQLRNDQKLLKRQIEGIDSLFAEGAEQDNRMRADIRSSLDELNQQLAQMQSQLSDMQQLVYNLSQRTSESPASVQPAATIAPGDSTAEDSTEVQSASSVDCRQLWDTAFKDMYRAQYDLAISGFMDYLKYCPGTDLADNSQYWIAESYYEMQQHEQAIEEYKKVLEKYPESEKRASAFFKLGRTYEKLADTTKALEYYLILKNDFPGSVEFDQVKDKIEAWQKTGEN
jgi:tol-pal system protein YbgF